MKTDREQHEQNRTEQNRTVWNHTVNTEENSFIKYKSCENTCNGTLLSHKKNIKVICWIIYLSSNYLNIVEGIRETKKHKIIFINVIVNVSLEGQRTHKLSTTLHKALSKAIHANAFESEKVYCFFSYHTHEYNITYIVLT